MRTAASYSARTSSRTGADCVIVTPPASRSKSKGAACGAGGCFVLVDLAVTVRWAAGPQPRARDRASHGIPRPIAFMDRVLIRTRMFYPSVVRSHRCGVRRLVRIAWRRLVRLAWHRLVGLAWRRAGVAWRRAGVARRRAVIARRRAGIARRRASVARRRAGVARCLGRGLR